MIAADGEFQASTRLAEAATAMAVSPGAMHLRTLQTMSEIAVEHNSTIIFPIPTEILGLLQGERNAAPVVVAAPPKSAPGSTS